MGHATLAAITGTIIMVPYLLMSYGDMTKTRGYQDVSPSNDRQVAWTIEYVNDEITFP